MAKIIKVRGSIREFTVASSGGLFEGGRLLTICSSWVGAFSRGGGAILGFTVIINKYLIVK